MKESHLRGKGLALSMMLMIIYFIKKLSPRMATPERQILRHRGLSLWLLAVLSYCPGENMAPQNFDQILAYPLFSLSICGYFLYVG